MKRFFGKIVFCVGAVLLAGAVLGAAEDPSGGQYRDTEAFKTFYKFLDSYEPGSEAYETLKQANAQGSSKLWQAERLRRAESLPTGAARQLALELMEDGAVAPELRARLRELFPPETKVVEDHRKRNEAFLRRMEPQLADMEKRLDVLTETLHRNTYNKGSFPAANVNFGMGYRVGAGTGLMDSIADASHFVNFGATISGQIPDGAFAISLGGTFDTPYNGNIRTFGVGGSNFSWGNLQVRYGEISYPTLSSLVYSGIGTSASSPFHGGYALSLAAVSFGPTAQGPANDMWNVQYNLRPRWWLPLNRVQVIYTPQNQFYESWNGSRFYDSTLRLDIASLSAGFISEIKPYVTGVYTYNDVAQLRASGFPTPALQNNRAAAVGLDSNWENGSSLLAEFATSYWARNDIAQAYADTAFYGLFTLPVSFFTLIFEGSQVGPNFITGGHGDRLSGNAQAGAYLDSLIDDYERRAGKRGTVSYQSMVREPEAMTNNSRRGSLKLEAKTGFASLGLTFIHSAQINPSGPWVQSHFVVNGLGYNGYGVYNRFGGNVGVWAPLGYGAATPGSSTYTQYVFSKPSLASATYNGVPLRRGDGSSGTVYWNMISQLLYRETQTWILLSQNGLGDSATRQDSVKYLESAKAALSLDLKPLFNRDLPFDLILDSQLRNLVEDPSLPSPSPDKSLFYQSVSNLNFRFGLSPNLDLLGVLSYEDWESRQTRFPVSWYIKYGGLGFDVKLDSVLTGLYMYFRSDRYEFWDPYYPVRNHAAWGANFGAGVSY